MSRFNPHNKRELFEGNRYYWRMPTGLPLFNNETATMELNLHDKKWKYEAFYTHSHILRLKFINISGEDHPVSFSSLGCGIIGDDQKEVAAHHIADHKDKGKWYFTVVDLISKSDICKLMLKNKALYIFVEMKRVNNEKTQLLPQILSRIKRKQIQVMTRRVGLPEDLSATSTAETGIKSIKRKQDQVTTRQVGLPEGLSATRTAETGTPKVETDFKEMLLSGKNSDVTIQVKQKKFMCHRCILGARSPVFSAMMYHDMKEKASGVVTIKDAEPTAFQEFLLYLYTGNKEHLNWKNLTDLYTLGDKYGVEDLKNLCVKNFKESITTVNFYEFFLLSQQHNDPELKGIIVKFFLEHSKEIVGSDNWMAFLSKNLVECNVLITALANK